MRQRSGHLHKEATFLSELHTVGKRRFERWVPVYGAIIEAQFRVWPGACGEGAACRGSDPPFPAVGVAWPAAAPPPAPLAVILYRGGERAF